MPAKAAGRAGQCACARPGGSRLSATCLAGLLALTATALHVAQPWHAAPRLWPDACGYLSAARFLAAHHRYGMNLIPLNPRTLAQPVAVDAVTWWPPLYPALLALAAGRGAHDPVHLIATAAALDLAGELAASVGFLVLVYLVGGSLAAAVCAAALYLLSAPCISEAPRVLSEHLFMPLAVWAAVTHWWALERTDWAVGLLAGLLWGLACLTRHAGLGLAGCASLAAWLSLRPREWRRAGPGILVPFSTAAVLWGSWLMRNYLVAHSLSSYYAPNRSPYLYELALSALGYLGGFCGNPLAPAALPSWNEFALGAGAALAVLAWATALAALGRTPASGPTRWLLLFALLGSASTVLTLAAARSHYVLNMPVGRMVVAPVSFSLAAFIALAARQPPLRLWVALLAALTALAGFQQGLANLLLPGGWQLLEDCRPLASCRPLQGRLAGRKVLLTSRAGLRPAGDLLAAGLFLPPTATVYWVDNPLYAGCVIGPETAAAFLKRAGVCYLLAGPPVRLPPISPLPPRPSLLAKLRYHAQTQFLTLQEGELAYLWRFRYPWGVASRPVVRVGEWELRAVVGAGPRPGASAASSGSRPRRPKTPPQPRPCRRAQRVGGRQAKPSFSPRPPGKADRGAWPLWECRLAPDPPAGRCRGAAWQPLAGRSAGPSSFDQPLSRAEPG
jgi:hypothetical protein